MEEEQLYNKAKAAMEEGKFEESLIILNTFDSSNNARINFLKGEACYQLQKWGDALNHFRKVLENDPENQKAKTYINMVQSILSFYHTDFFNP